MIYDGACEQHCNGWSFFSSAAFDANESSPSSSSPSRTAPPLLRDGDRCLRGRDPVIVILSDDEDDNDGALPSPNYDGDAAEADAEAAKKRR